MVILHLAAANLKRKKGMAATLLFLSFMAVFFLDMGLVFQSGMGRFFEEKRAELNNPDFFLVVENDRYENSFEDFIAGDHRTEYWEKEEVIYMENTENNLNSLKFGAVIFNRETKRDLAPFHLVKEDASVPEDKAIYLPLLLEGSGAALGKEYVLTYKEEAYSFQVAGFFETAYMGGSNGGSMKYFVSGACFEGLYENTASGKALSVRMKQGTVPVNEASVSYRDDFIEHTDYYAKVGSLMGVSNCLSALVMQEQVLSMMLVPALCLISFAVLIGVIVIIMVHCKVTEEIEENMQNIGSLQALGYTTGQIMLSMTAEFVWIGFVGIIAGILGSYLLMPFMTHYNVNVVGLIWKPGLHPGEDGIAALVILTWMAFSAFLGTWKIRKLPPVKALRKGVGSHHFGRNFFPLSRRGGDVRLRLSLKNIFCDSRQNVTTVIIVLLCVFAVGCSLTLYSTFVADTTTLPRMTGLELADIQISSMPHIDLPAFQQELEAREEVAKTNLNTIYMVKADGMEVMVTVSADYGKMEVLAPVRGRFPLYDNEIVLTESLLKKLDKELGDDVAVMSEGITRTYYITGTGNATNNGGNMGMLTLEGMQRISPYFEIEQIDLYVTQGVDIDSFIKQLYNDYGGKGFQGGTGEGEKFGAAKRKAEEMLAKMMEEYGASDVSYAVMLNGEMLLSGDSSAYKVKEITNMKGYLSGQLDLYASMITGIVTVFFFVILLVIGMVISITIKSILRKKREEFGIYKALGYTTKDLAVMIAFNFAMIGFFATFLGGFLCYTLSGRLVLLLFSGAGLSIGSLPVNLLWIFFSCIGIFLFLCVFAYIKARQVKKITVYELLTE